MELADIAQDVVFNRLWGLALESEIINKGFYGKMYSEFQTMNRIDTLGKANADGGIKD